MPHAGAMVLLGRVVAWDHARIVCAATSHRDPANPLRHAGRLAALCGAEYALQAAALHGALCADGQPQPAGYAASLRDIVLHVERLDTIPGELRVTAILVRRETFGMLYDFALDSEPGAPLLQGRFSIALPR